MYADFFGLNDIPFSIAPNPHYLFMSDRHKEALAHLTYGLGSTGGFVLLTGEVGTGKTTVSRRLLDQLGDDTQAAFILNPTLSSQELLATICDELKIRYRKTGATLKTLTDKIQEKLLKNHHAGLNTVLIVDEAQHLKPETLEQLRLLTNLETHTKKLLQVILIGQPELQQLLQRQDLRQLAQRITARYHLLPLNKKEVAQYIEHRVAVAGGNTALFSPSAITTIHQLSKGIPRLINLLCDRALLGAFGKGSMQVDKKLVIAASSEALGEEYQPKAWWRQKSVKTAAIVAGVAIALGLGYGLGNQGVSSTVNAAFSADSGQNLQGSNATLIGAPSAAQISQSQDLAIALNKLFSLWRLTLDESLAQPCQTAENYQLSCYWFKGNVTSLLTLNYPALFKFYDAQGNEFFATLQGFEQNDGQLTLRFDFAGSESTVDKLWLDKHWRGTALIFWQPVKLSSGEVINSVSKDSSLDAIQWLENQLSNKQQRPARTLNDFDARLQNQLAQFQRAHSLAVQPQADQTTLMVLTNAVSEGMPIFNRTAP